MPSIASSGMPYLQPIGNTRELKDGDCDVKDVCIYHGLRITALLLARLKDVRLCDREKFETHKFGRWVLHRSSRNKRFRLRTITKRPLFNKARIIRTHGENKRSKLATQYTLHNLDLTPSLRARSKEYGQRKTTSLDTLFVVVLINLSNGDNGTDSFFRRRPLPPLRLTMSASGSGNSTT